MISADALRALHPPLLQRAFDTVPLQGRDWLTCVLVASSVLWLRERSKAAWHLGHLAAGMGSKRRSTIETP
ncbi:MAG: hypothetical protein HGA45_16310 [Chloroflexales bacterium]|nr:hypothetical protein [Chloroflexales bacterium]